MSVVPQPQRHVASLQILGVQAQSALVAAPLHHLAALIQVDALRVPEPPDRHGNGAGLGRELTGEGDVFTRLGPNIAVRGGGEFKATTCWEGLKMK